jgi:hypothetical protein
LQRFRLARLDLVLDSHMRRPRRSVLHRQEPVQGQREVCAYILELLAPDTKSRPAAQIHHSCQVRARRWRSGIGRQPLAEFAVNPRRKVGKECQVNGNPVALHRIMAAAQPFEPGEILIAKQGTNDDRGCVQIST